MSTSGINALSITQSGLGTTSTPSNSQQAAAKTLGQLLQDIESGNLSGAQKDLTTLNQQLGIQQGQSQTGDSSNPLGALLSSLNKDLGSGNIASAQSDVQNFLTALEGSSSAAGASGASASAAAGPAAPTGATNSTSSASSNSGGISDALKQDFLTLIDNVQSGNVQGAQSAYQNLTSLLSGSSDPQSSSSSSSSSSTHSSSQGSAFRNLINNFGNSISSGDLASAQQQLQSYFQSSGHGSGVFVTANA